MKNSTIIKLLAGLSLFCLFGCATVQSPTTSTTPSATDQFWTAMKGDLATAKAFFASDLAKKNAPLFFDILWKGGFTGYQMSGGNVNQLCTGAIVPFCSAISTATNIQNPSISIAQIESIAAGTGKTVDLSKYNPVTNYYAPVLEFIINAAGSDSELALFYINCAATEGVKVSQTYITISMYSTGLADFYIASL